MADQPPPIRDPDDRQRILDRISREQPEPTPLESQSPARPRGSLMSEQSAFITLVCALIFLYVGFTRTGMVATSGGDAYAAAVKSFPITAKICGFTLLAAAALAFFRIRAALLVEMAASALATLACLVIGGIWLSNSDNEGFLLLVFALVNGSATRSAFLEWKSR